MRNERPRFDIDETPEEILDLGDEDVVRRLAEILGRQRPLSPGQRRDEASRRVTGEEVISQILPVLDGFERVLDLARQDELIRDERFFNWFRSVEAIYKRLLKALRKYGLEPIESKGKPVDFDLHDIVEVLPDRLARGQYVVEEEQKGYRLGDKVLREARVIVTQPAPKARQDAEGNNSEGGE